ncbi:unnamed protein product [Notodromas monacha]|uniref:Vacuolar protein sorting-associated protein 26B n=2 Tax=Notodromas monacha TaxID=399045 RepID=A0A7R9BJX9_9CRUS|nr:unnamed protein product [Notodromas monacha]CAG0916028.1 unnamed protein product [Notodromas monacha]
MDMAKDGDKDVKKDAGLLAKEADSRARNRQLSRRFNKNKRAKPEVQVAPKKGQSDDVEESVCAILAPDARRNKQQSAESSRIGLVSSPLSANVSARTSSAEASFAVSLNEVKERTDLRRDAGGYCRALLCGGGARTAAAARMRSAADVARKETCVQRVLSRLEQSAERPTLVLKLNNAMSGIQRELSGAEHRFGARKKSSSSSSAGRRAGVKAAGSVIPGQAVYRGRAVVREILSMRQSGGTHQEESLGFGSPEADDAAAAADNSESTSQVVLSGGLKSASGTASKTEQTSEKNKTPRRTPSGESVTGPDDNEDGVEEEGGDSGVRPPEVRFEDMLYLWDLNRDLKNLVHSRIRDLGMPKFLGMGIVNKGNVAPEIMLPELGPIPKVEAELREMIKRPSFKENRPCLGRIVFILAFVLAFESISALAHRARVRFGKLRLVLILASSGRRRCPQLREANKCAYSRILEASSFFGFGQGADIDIILHGSETRKMAEIKTEDGKKERHYLYYDGESVGGKVNVTLKKPGTKLEHQGIKIEFVGQIELYYDRGNHHEFTSLVKELARPGILAQNTSFTFEFNQVEKPYESYTGGNVRLRYFLRVTILRRISDIVREVDIIVHTLSSYPEINSSIKMEVGIEDCLHIEFEYNKSKYHLKDVIVGKIFFLLVRIKIKHMEIAIIKRETTGAGPNTFNENETITKYEIMDGAPVRGESIPIRLFLAGYDLSPSMRDINKKFSVKYYLNLVLVDEEERRYFKQQKERSSFKDGFL